MGNDHVERFAGESADPSHPFEVGWSMQFDLAADPAGRRESGVDESHAP